MTLKSIGCSKPNYREPTLCQSKEFNSSATKVVDLSSRSFSANSIGSNPASEDAFHFYKKRKMDKECNSLLANANIRESTARSLLTSKCNLSPAQDGDDKSLMVYSGVQKSNFGPNSAGYKGNHEVNEEASVGNHLRNLVCSNYGVHNGLQSSTSSIPSYISYRIKDAWECSSPDVDAAKLMTKLMSARNICISILKRDILPTKESELSQQSPPDDNESIPLFKCMRCGSMEDPFKMLICDCCEGAFHLSCCKPRVKKIPEEKWCCQVCSRKKPKRQHKNLSPKHKLPNPSQRHRRGLGTIQDMLADAEPYQSDVRIGSDFQADVPEWSGPISSNEDEFVEPSELDPNEIAVMDSSQLFKGKKSSVSNWIQCREVLSRGIVCGKWRRAPLLVDQSSNWDCSCSVVWDPIHADCAVPQELETDEVLEQLKYINKLKDRLGHSKKKR